jgi:hypothetical protein
MSKKKVAAAANEPIILEPRDVVFNFESAHKMNFLLQDAVEMHAFLWKMQEKAQPKKEEEIGPIVDRIFSLLKHGKEHELAGLKDVPQPFLRSTGRMLEKDGDAYKIITDAAAKMIISKKLMDEMKTAKDYDDEAFLDFKAMWKRKAIPANLVQQSPDIKDAVLLKCQDAALGEKLYENQLGNRILFGCASHKVTASSNSSSQRVKIALEILKGLDESDIVSDNKDAPKYSRFMVRSAGDEDANINWSILSLVEAAEFIQTFVFEVFLEKEIHVSGGAADNQDPVASDGPGVVPIKEPTEYDVLFGRGGMTNGHTGNRRFRDIIALHRPDYIRAIKMDKPAVARKIVKAIRCGNPPGRCVQPVFHVWSIFLQLTFFLAFLRKEMTVSTMMLEIVLQQRRLPRACASAATPRSGNVRSFVVPCGFDERTWKRAMTVKLRRKRPNPRTREETLLKARRLLQL